MYNPRPQFNYTAEQTAEYRAGYDSGYYGRSFRATTNEGSRGYADGRSDRE